MVPNEYRRPPIIRKINDVLFIFVIKLPQAITIIHPIKRYSKVEKILNFPVKNTLNKIPKKHVIHCKAKIILFVGESTTRYKNGVYDAAIKI